MKYWPVIRHIRYLTSPRWRHMGLALDRVRRAINRGLERPKDADAFIMSAGSWLEDAEYEWKRLQAIRDGKE